MSSTPDYKVYFADYAEVLNRSLVDEAAMGDLRAFHAEHFVSAGVAGAVEGGANDEAFGERLREGSAFYRDIGLKKMTLIDVAVTGVDDGHDMVRAYFRADYVKRSGDPVSIEFDLVYMLQRRPDGPRIFATVAGDEMGLYRQHGLVDAEGKPG